MCIYVNVHLYGFLFVFIIKYNVGGVAVISSTLDNNERETHSVVFYFFMVVFSPLFRFSLLSHVAPHTQWRW